jgi:hypothetical protein
MPFISNGLKVDKAIHRPRYEASYWMQRHRNFRIVARYRLVGRLRVLIDADRSACEAGHNLGELFVTLWPAQRPGTGKSQARELAMSESIIEPVAAGHRRRVRVRGIRVLRLCPALVLLLCGSVRAAEEAPSPPALEKDSFYLKSAGFSVQFANDPAGQKELRALPAHRFVAKGDGDALRYFYAEPQHCVCIFVGTRQAYDSYREMLRQPLRPAHTVSPDYKTTAGVLLSNQPLRQSTRRDPTNLSDYLGTISSGY